MEGPLTNKGISRNATLQGVLRLSLAYTFEDAD